MKLWKLALAGLGGASLIALAPGCPAPQDPVQLHGQVRLTLLHTADMHSRLFPYDMLVGQADESLGLGAANTIVNVGGAARVSHIVGRERSRAERVLHLDGGDCFQGAPIFNYFSGEAEVRALSQMGTDVMVLANHEFDRGALNVANQLQNWATFPVLAANYKVDSPAIPGGPALGRVLSPFQTFNVGGLKVLVVGMANLSSITSLFEQPNTLGVQPLNTTEVAQFYIDLMRPYVDLVVFVTHLGLESDEQMIENTTGIDVVLGGHNHIVLQPPKTVMDCSKVDADGNHYIEVADGKDTDPTKAPTFQHRRCTPRPVLLAHSGAFAKYVGRLDLVVSDDTSKDVDGKTYDPSNGFEVISHDYHLFPVTAETPEDPVMVSTLLPYRQALEGIIDLDLLVGYSPDGSKRSAPSGGDSALGNMVATAMWLRQGVKTDFALTNTTGIRTDMVPGPVTVEQMFNIFPFDNSISKMQLSGVEVQQLFDFVAHRSAGRGCTSQAQIAGARVVLNCTGCTRQDHVVACAVDTDCDPGATCQPGGTCTPLPCAEQIYIGEDDSRPCTSNDDCGGAVGSCDNQNLDSAGKGRCGNAIDPIASYDFATSNYLAAGGSGFRVLQRNTTQFDTKIQQRDALTDYVRNGRPCGWDPLLVSTTGGLTACSTDGDCGTDRVCACMSGVTENPNGTCTSKTCDPGAGRCVLAACRDDVAAFHRKRCAAAPDEATKKACDTAIAACAIAGEECKFLACVDRRIGNFADNRILMEGH